MNAVPISVTLDGVAHESLAAPNRTPVIAVAAHLLAYSVVEEWHRVTHIGAFPHCDQQPCHAIHLRDAPRQVHASNGGAR